MKKITDFIVKFRNVFLVLFVVLSGISLYLSTKVNINTDIMKYLPSTSETKQGYDIMHDDFPEEDTSTLNVMYKNLSKDKKTSRLKELESIKGVKSVEYDDSSSFNKDKYTLYIINVDDYAESKTSKDVYDTVRKEYKPFAMSGSIYDKHKTILKISIVIGAIICAMIILIILSDSYLEPFLYLISIGIAVFINKGTNIMFESVSEITESIVAILQLALSMDYSIMLSNRYKQECAKSKDKVEAMKKALYASFSAISSSSVTTVVGLLALIFMSFTIGKDLGLVLAKGVILSLVSIFFCLPGLLLLFDKLIQKTKKRPINFKLGWLGAYSYKTRFAQLFAIVILFVVAFIIKGNITTTYTGSEQDEVGRVFDSNNQMAIVYKNEYEDIISNYCKTLERDEKIDQVLCYSNTINEPLSYNELNSKLSSLGKDTSIDESLIKIIYYNYYNKNTSNKMTLDEFINFIRSDIFTDEELSKDITPSMKENINLLSNFTNKDKLNKKRTIKEISELLNISYEDANSIFIYYEAKNANTKMTINEFTSFLLNDVSNDKTYSKELDKNTITKLKRLNNFTNKNNINKKMNSKELSNIFGIDESLIKQLFLFYNVTNESNTRLTLNEFASIALSMSKDDMYKSEFDENTINSLKLLLTLSDKRVVETPVDKETMNSYFNLLGIDNSLINNLYILYDGFNTNTKLSLSEFASIALSLSNQDEYKNYFDDNTINELKELIALSTYKDTILPNSKLYEMFNISTPVQYVLNNYIEDNTMSPYSFVNFLLNTDAIKNNLNEEQVLSLNKALFIMSNKDTKYSNTEINKVLNKNQLVINMIYGVKDNSTNTIPNISLKDLFNFINTNKHDLNLFVSFNNEINSKLSLAITIMNNLDTAFNYNEISSIINLDSSKVKKIYGVYDYNQGSTKLSPLEFSNLIINNKDNELLKGKLNNNSLKELSLVRTVMISTLNNTKYDSTRLSNILNINKDKMSLIFGLYDNKKVTSNNNISLYNYVDFIVNNVMNNKDYSNKFDKSTKDKLTTILSVMNNSINGVKYTTGESFASLNKLSNDLDKSLIDLVYIYYGSSNNYDNNYKLTVEEVVNYLNDDILNDKRFSSFMSDEMREKIVDAKEAINKAKNLLVSSNYSRLVINSSYAPEDKETYEFINRLEKDLGDKEGIYIVGHSSMAVEMSKTFDNELNKITILTMLFIFVVVAFTFKDLIIPFVLVLIIQTAVYVTMSCITISGGKVYFIALLIVQAILMGATIDYAIVYTSYYLEGRKKMNIKDSVLNAYNKSIHTILSSSSILIIVTLVVANFASAIAAKICETISEGTLAAVILILFVLPGVLATCDKVICRKGYFKENKQTKKRHNNKLLTNK